MSLKPCFLGGVEVRSSSMMIDDDEEEEGKGSGADEKERV